MTRLFLKSLNLLVLIVALAACSGSSTGADYCSNDDNCGVGKICKQGACVTGTRMTTGGDTNAGDIDATDSNTNDGASSDGGDSPGDATDEGPGDPLLGPVDMDPLPDTKGPEIVIESPTAYELVGRVVYIEASVTDVSAVDLESVSATLANSVQIPLVPVGVGRFAGATLTVGSWTPRLYVTIEVTARDSLGNEAYVGHEFAVDNASPSLTLENRSYRDTRKNSEGIRECSRVYHALGEDVVKHGDVIDSSYVHGLSFVPRAIIQDHGNSEGLYDVAIPIASIDHASTKLYFLTSAGLGLGQPLVVAGDDGYCMINPLVEPDPLAPSPTQAVVQALVGVPASGVADFRSGEGGIPDYCAEGSDDPLKDGPPDVCDAALGFPIGLTKWIPAADPLTGAVYVLNEYSAESMLTCGGGLMDVRNLPDGPLCMAARASDNLGNENVSSPIAICIDNSGTACSSFNAAAVACSSVCTSR